MGFGASQAWIMRFDGLTEPICQYLSDMGWQINGVATNDVKRVFARRCITNRGSRRNITRVITRDIRNHQRHHARGVAGCGQPPTFDRGEMPPNAVHLTDVSARLQ